MHSVDITFRCYLSTEQREGMQQLQEEGDFGTQEAIELIEQAHDSALIKVEDDG